jgi:hypothetical protein
MTTFKPHLNRTTRYFGAALLLPVMLALTFGGPAVRCASATTSPTSVRSYGWPVAPFNRQHAIRGGFGDPRTLFLSPPTRAGLYHGSGSFSFHEGVDISAPDGTAVYPVRDGVVLSLNADRVFVSSGNGDRFEYWHIAPSVRIGDRVTTDRTVLGHIIRGTGHVHLTEVDAGRVTDPLLPGHLTPYRDTTTPTVSAIQFRTNDEAPPLMANLLRGSVLLYAEAYDTPTVPVPGEWHDMPMTPAVVSWHIETWNGKVKTPEKVAWDARVTLPSNSAFWAYYARGTFQNMAVFGGHYSWGQPGCFDFRLGTLDTRRLRDSVYRLVVTARDVRGNHSSTAIRFSVHNKPGWVGV